MKTFTTNMRLLLIIGLLFNFASIGNTQCNDFTADFTYDHGMNNDNCNDLLFFANPFMADDYFWDFGDGTTSSHPEVTSHTFTEDGIYEVCLAITYAGCTDTICKTIEIDCANASDSCDVVADFDIYPDTLNCNSIYINNQSINGSSYSWDFGDGTYSNFQHPGSHVYTNDGTYMIDLNVESFSNGFFCSDSISKTITINCDTTATPSDNCDFPVDFTYDNFMTNDNCNNILFFANPFMADDYHWDFGDGTTSNQPEVTNHIFAEDGTYNVCLAVTYDGCTDSICKLVEIDCSGTTPADSCDFSHVNIIDSIECNTVYFTPSDTNLSYEWDFGDGNSSTDTSPSHVYTSNGNYSVTIYLYDTISNCTDTLYLNVEIDCSDPCEAYVADFDYYIDSSDCKTVYIQATTTNADHYFWDFSDGGSFSGPNPGSYTFDNDGEVEICLAVYDNSCGDSICKTIELDCDGTTPVDPCDSLVADFDFYVDSADCKTIHLNTDTTLDASYYWQFGEGTMLYGPDITSYTYDNEGEYEICLALYQGSCGDSICKTVTIDCNTSTPSDTCSFTTDFTYDNFMTNDNCNNILFFANPFMADDYHWNFGDGTTSNQPEVTNHIFADDGTYNVCLAITYDGCTDTICKLVEIDCSGTTPADSCDFSHVNIIDSIECNTVYFTPSDTNLSYEWDFGDGNSSTDTSPSHVYTSNGNYSVTIYLYDTISNCTDTLYLNVEINCSDPCEAYVADFDYYINSSDCKTVYVQATTTNADHYFWDFSDGGSFSGPNPGSYTFDNDGEVEICLAVYDNSCGDSICKTIELDCGGTEPIDSCDLDTGFTITDIGQNEFIFTPTTIDFNLNYMWVLGDGTTITGAVAQHTYSNDDDYNVTLVVSNCECILSSTTELEVDSSLGIPTEDLNENVTVYPNPFGDYITIDYETFEGGDVELVLYDNNGRILLTDAFYALPGANQHQLDVHDISKGMYLLKMYNKSTEKVIVSQLIKQ